MTKAEPETFVGRAPVTDDHVLAALPFLPYDRALEACKLLVEGWLRDMSYCNAGPTKQKWELREPGYMCGTDSPPQKVGDRSWRLILATQRNHYYITVRPTYLGCAAVSRVYAAGEDHVRGNDLPDGPFNRITWSRILTEMLAYELVDIPKEDKPPELVNMWAFVDEAEGKDRAPWSVEHERRPRGALLSPLPTADPPAPVQLIDNPTVDPSGHLPR